MIVLSLGDEAGVVGFDLFPEGLEVFDWFVDDKFQGVLMEFGEGEGRMISFRVHNLEKE